MVFSSEISVGEILTSLSIIGSAIAILYSWHRDRKLKAAEWMSKFWDSWDKKGAGKGLDMVIDGTLNAETYYKKDDGNLWELLYYLEMVCLARQSRIISKDVFGLHTYDILKVYSSKQVGKYLDLVESELKKVAHIKPFPVSRTAFRELTNQKPFQEAQS